jgi:hypothetical protein
VGQRRVQRDRQLTVCRQRSLVRTGPQGPVLVWGAAKRPPFARGETKPLRLFEPPARQVPLSAVKLELDLDQIYEDSGC